MPCWEISKLTVKFSVANQDFLLKALEKANIRYELGKFNTQFIYTDAGFEFNLEKEEIQYNAYNSSIVEPVINKIKRKYSEVILEEVARKHKWLLKKTAQKRAYQLRRF
jgi:hypothetical protein